ncbi:MAG: dihydrodipicolinate reductase [Desulforegulaceae bacterium]|nr:dihydrodipicolinate reductase [Desulforegulaceae bacterium]
MEKINLMINGIPGNVAKNILEHLDPDVFNLVEASLTGPDVKEDFFEFKNKKIKLLKPDSRDEKIKEILEKFKNIIAIDYTHPTAVNENAKFYVKHKIPFVMGTTGGNREELVKAVEKSEIPAVIAPNMAKQIVGFQAMMEFAANNFPDLFKGYSLEIKESHQSGKADTSGTAKAMVTYFKKLGLNFDTEEIKKERNKDIQENEWKIPKEHLEGHAWHKYSLVSDDKSAKFEFIHNINGRDIYSRGTIDAVLFLNKKIKENFKGKAFTMIDVLKG